MTEPCECAGDLFIPGLHANMTLDDVEAGFIPGVERHDECAVYSGDLEAAFALAQHLSTTRKEHWTVLYLAEADRPCDDAEDDWLDGDGHVYDGTPLGDDVYIASGTDPWLVRT